jgi:PAP2 superfamily/PEP-CTERM motif
MTIHRKVARAQRRSMTALLLLASTSFLTAPANATIDVNSDPILFWNDIAITNATAFTPGGAPAQTRAYAMVNIAMYDAVNATLGNPNRSYLTNVVNSGGDSRAAAAQAAHDVLVALNPGNASIYDSKLVDSLAMIGSGAAKTSGIATGSAYAAAILANRTGDGASTSAIPYVTTGVAGDYRFTPNVTAAVTPGWGNVKPFALSSASMAALDPGPPPALDSVAYANAVNEVKGIVNALRPATGLTLEQQDQKNSAFFWDVSNGGTWIRVGLTVADKNAPLDTLGYAQVFATLATGLADAAIGVWDAKYDYRLWRPITAIQNADIDGNPMTDADPNWTPLFGSPGHPSYVSAHSGLSATASTILQSYFGNDDAFTFSIGPDTRSFTSLTQAELDAANSRLWGGIHFRFDNDAGLALGHKVGATMLANRLFGPVPEPSTWTMMIAGFGCVGFAMRTRRRTLRVVYP